MGTEIDTLRDALASFAHGGFRISVRDPDPQAPDLIYADILVAGERVGWLKRRVIDNEKRPLYVIHEELELMDAFQQQGFGTALTTWSEEQYRTFGVAHVELTASKRGGYAWARAGYDFDLGNAIYQAAANAIDAQTDAQRRAAAVIHTMDYEGALIGRTYGHEEREPNPREILEEIAAASDDGRHAVDAFLRRVPTPADVAAGRLDDKFQTPSEIAAFDRTPESRGIPVARRVLCAAPWFGRKDLR